MWYKYSPRGKETKRKYDRLRSRTLKYIEQQREYRRGSKYREYVREHTKQRRLNLMNHLGGIECKHCGCVYYTILDIDHIDPKHSKEDRIRFSSNHIMNAYYLKHLEEASQKLQILCRACNGAKNRKY